MIGSVVLYQINPVSTAVIARQDDILDKRAVGLMIEVIGLVAINVFC